jgi:hypothetical protein
MRLAPLVSNLLLSATAVSAGRSLRHVGSKRFEEFETAAKDVRSDGQEAYHQFMGRQATEPLFLNANTSSK